MRSRYNSAGSLSDLKLDGEGPARSVIDQIAELLKPGERRCMRCLGLHVLGSAESAMHESIVFCVVVLAHVIQKPEKVSYVEIGVFPPILSNCHWSGVWLAEKTRTCANVSTA